jgi:pimeloyl-ACP methyl ester carboxylesterase
LEADIKVPVFALHGQEDKVINPPVLENCTILPHAGHGMVVSHPQQVGEFLCDTVGKIDQIHLPE